MINCVEDRYWEGGRFFLGLMVGYTDKVDQVMNFDKRIFILKLNLHETYKEYF